jgi:hypothetical protein
MLLHELRSESKAKLLQWQTSCAHRATPSTPMAACRLESFAPQDQSHPPQQRLHALFAAEL